MGNTKTYENCMCDSDIMEVYKKDRCIGNELMLEKYHDYIYYIIKKHYPSFNREASELFQHGAIDIMNALQTYDPSKASFTTYCTPYIKKELGKHLRFMAGESSEYFASVHNSVERAKSKIETAGDEATVDKIMDETGLSHKIVKRELKVDRTKVSFDALESMTADMQLSDDFVVDDLLSSIPKKNSAIIKMKVLDGISFVQIAKELGEPVVKIRQCYNEGIDMLRQNI